MDRHRFVRISKFLSLVLRHRPEKVGIHLDPAGWVDIAALLQACARVFPITQAELETVVAENDKQRFELSDDRNRIRASQGHSISVELGYEPSEPPEMLYHGTPQRNVGAIGGQGLRKGRRHHVHLSSDPDTATKVGSRRGTPVVIRVLAGNMHRAGYVFFRSTNGVWLTDHVPREYLVFPQ